MLTKKPYHTPTTQVIMALFDTHLLASSMIDVGGNTDHFDSNRQEPSKGSWDDDNFDWNAEQT